ncbi:hypothetical protein TIFTF001_028385 [Ficus carica]|uniref:Secreted protein n=1 Tax=Ficus carica TaxID=3494 RepID=A0AA88DQ38_FICCA|nr:hypothetical protein TIFTF001_028385 [Ficus carica]
MSSFTLPFAFSLTLAGARTKAVKNDGACEGSGHRSGWSWRIGECGLLGRQISPGSSRKVVSASCFASGAEIAAAAAMIWSLEDLRKWFLSMETALSRYIFRFESAEVQRSLITDFGLFTQGI